MGWPTVALLSLSTLTLVTSHRLPVGQVLPSTQKHIPPSNILSFQRTSVEGIPNRFAFIRDDDNNDDSEYEFGSISLPLREAVEALPNAIDNQFEALQSDIGFNTDSLSGRTPLRDAVEHRPPPPLGNNIVSHDLIWLEQLSPPIIRRSHVPNKILCHFDGTAVYRTEPFSLYPDGIPNRMCTHIIYNAATLDPNTMSVIPIDSTNNKLTGDYKAVTDLRKKNPSLRVLISINFPKNGKFYRQLFSSNDGYRQLCGSILNFVDKNEFDGVEINWENALNYQLKLILNHLYTPLNIRGRTLIVAMKSHDYVDSEIAEISHLILLQSSKNAAQKYATLPAPLTSTLDFVKKWIDSGVNSNKLILDVPLFGHSYTLKRQNESQSGSPVNGPGISSLYTNIEGTLAYYEICEKMEEMWDYKRDKDGAYLLRGDQWIGFDDPITMRVKVAFVRSMELGGISLSTLDLDDFVGICGDPWPMLSIANKGFLDNPTGLNCFDEGVAHVDPDNKSAFLYCYRGKFYRVFCLHDEIYDPMKSQCREMTGAFDKESKNFLIALREKHQREKLRLQHSGPRVVCYMTSWALYRKGDGKFVPEHLDARLCTDVIYAFAGLNPETLTLQPFDSWADIDNGLYQRITSMKDTRVLLAIGGWTDSAGNKYSRLVSSPSARNKFITTTINFLHTHNFDGISIEWNYPKCWQSNCKKGLDSDRPNFTKFIQELREAFDNESPHLILAVSLSGYKEVIDRAYDIRELSNAADFLSVMTYDYHGAWESQTGHLAPLYSSPNDLNPYYNMNWTINYLVSLGAEKMKLVPGIPFYGQAYRLTQPDHSRLGDSAAGPGNPGEYTAQPGMLAYYEICERVKRQGWKVGDGPSAHFKNQFVSYDDVNSIFSKAEWILKNGFGGATAWTVDLDDFINRCCTEPFPLLRSLNRGLGRLLDPTPFGENCERPLEPITPQAPIMTTHSDANDSGLRPTRPMTSSTTVRTTTIKTTTWPTWTESTSKKPMTITTSWPTWTQSTSKKPMTIITSWPTWTWSTSSPITTTTTIRAPTEWTITTTTRKPIIEENHTENSSSPAPGKPCAFGDYIPDPMNCGKYFRCVFGELKRESCTPGLHWDGTRRFCDWPHKVKCQQTSVTQSTQRPITTSTQWWSETTRPTKRPQTTTSRYTTVTRPVGTFNKKCVNGQYYAYPKSCDKFLICVNGDLVIQQCGPGLTWNDNKSMCDWASKNPCKDKPKENAPLMKEMESCSPGTFTQVEGDCQSYYACSWGRHMKFSCAPGLHFNKETKICDWPHRAKCDEEVSSETEFPPLEGMTTQRPTRPTMKPITSTTFMSTKKTTQMPWTESTKPLPPAIVDPNKISPLSGYFKVVCYFTNWAWYRRGVGKYLPEHIDHTLCTHIVYGFAVLDYSKLTIKAHDSWADYDNRFYDRVVAYKKRGLKVLLALGGWNDSAGDKYSRLVNSPSSRQRFIEHAIKFIEKYDFDGLDLDWEYPVCWQVDCKKGPDSDKAGFASLLRELSAEMKPRGLLMSAAVSPSKTVIDKGYDVPALAKYLDWIAVMAYDYHGQWDKKTGHVAPLYYHQDDEFYFFNANYSINYWISKGAPPRSIVMGMPLYGQAFSINDPHAGTGLNSPASAGTAGEFTRAAGFLSYYEICDRIKNHGWKVVQDPQRRMGPYAFKGNQWVSFDDAKMIRQKAQFVRDMGLGGGMVWALDLDDFKGKCGEGEHPLMHTLQTVLADGPNEHDRPIMHPPSGQELEWVTSFEPPKIMEHLTHVTNVVTNKNEEFKVVCYFTNWAWYRQAGGRFVPEDIDSDLCTHIIYGFAVLDGSTLTIKPHDSWADLDNKFYERVVEYKNKGIKVLIAIGGWNDSQGDKYSRLVNSHSARSSFITHVIQFIEKYNFDGLDLDWEYPVCWQVDCNRGPASDKEGFSMFVKDLSKAFKPKGLLLSSAVSPSKRVIDAGYDVPVLSQYLDWISVMTYDFHGQWDKKTGHVAPLYARPDDWEQTFNANFSIHYWLQLGIPPKKLVMGAPLYGQSFSLANRNAAGLNEPTYGGGEAGEATRARGFLAYYEICERTLKKGWKVVQDPERRIGPYAFKGDQWVSFDDAEQTKLKAEFIKSLGLGGGMVWAMDLDDFKNRCGCEPSPLLRTMNRVLRNYPVGPTCKITEFHHVETLPSTQEPIHQTTDTINESTSPPPTYLPPSITSTESDDSVVVVAGPPPPTPLPIGECEDRQFIPHKEDCSKYLICNFGQVSEFSCPSGLYWNQDRCDWPENSQCRVRSAQYEVESNSITDLIDVPKAKVICYFTNWAWYRPGHGKYLPENIDPNLCTHIVYGFVVLDSSKLKIKMHDSLVDIDNDFYHRITAFKSKGIKVLLALGGWNDSSEDKYSRLVNSQTARNRFVKDTILFVQKHGFDGLDFDWEYPVCWHVNCERGPTSDKKAFSLLIKELSDEFKSSNLLLSAAVSPSKRVIDEAYDVPILAKYLDWISVMTYDFHGHWEKKTGHVAPLYYYPDDEFDYFNVNFSMRYWITKGAPPSKLIMGIPMYGQSFTLVNSTINGLQSMAYGPGYAGTFTRLPGFLSFYEICEDLKNGGWNIKKDPERRIGPYARKDDQWISYDDVSNVLMKAALIRELKLAGGMIWALDLDDFNGKCGCGNYPLLTALNNGLAGKLYEKDCT